MAVVSFGYTAGDSPNGSSSVFSTTPQACIFFNDTGGYVWIDKVEILNVTSTGSGTASLSLYWNDRGNVPGKKAGSTVTLGSWSPGTLTFNLPAPIILAPDQGIWVATDCTTTINASTVLNNSLPLAPPDARSVFDIEGGSFSDPWSQGLALAFQRKIFPAVLSGEDTGTLPTTEALTNLLITEPLIDGDSSVKTSLIVSEPLTEGGSQVQTNLIVGEPLTEGYSNVKTCLLVLECLVPVPPEEFMSTDPFPGFGNSQSDPSVPAGANPASTVLPGLSFSVHKRPGFNTRINSAASGNEVRNALQEYPVWEFELTYEFLEDSTGANSSLKTIMGFFLSRQGAFDSWLFKDPDDYLVSNGWQGDCDGVTTQFSFKRSMGGFAEKVGQVDTANTITLYLSIEEADAIPATPGPYTITVVNAADFVEDLGVTKGGVAMTKVTGAPAAGEYSVNEGTGEYTFNATDESDAVVISYRYEVDPADYTVTMPNLVVFDSAPADGATLSASFQFFFACRFLEDQADFEKFYDKLWALNTCEFRSIIQ